LTVTLVLFPDNIFR